MKVNYSAMRRATCCALVAAAASAAALTYVPITSPSVRWLGRRVAMPAVIPPRAVDAAAAAPANGTTAWAIDWEGTEAELGVTGATVVAAVILDSSGGNSRFAGYLSTINTTSTAAVAVGAADPDPAANAVPGLRTGLLTTSGVQTVYVLAAGPILTALPGGVRVRLQLLTEPSFIDDGEAGPLQLAGFLTDGAVLPPRPLAPRRLEILGDSLTAGYGAGFDDPFAPPAGGPSTPPPPRPAPLQPCGGGVPMNDVSTTYGARLCAAFGADCTWAAVSGVCIMAHPGSNLPDFWNVTLGSMLARGRWARYLAPWDQCDPALGGGPRAPDGVIVNLGENDMHAAPKPPSPAWLAQLASSYVEFVGALWTAYARCSGSSNKAAPTFFLAIGPHEAGQSAAMAQALPALAAAGYSALLLNATVPLPPALPAGCGGHPGPTLHAAAAAAAAPVVSAALGWDYTGL